MTGKVKEMVSALIAAVAILATAPAARAEESRFSGFHLGAFAGVALIDSTVEFPATATHPAAKFVDQGGDGPIFGIRGGWGAMIGDQTYAGVEGEFLVPYNVTSRLMALGVEYRARLRNEFGLYGRIGIMPDRASLLYLRAGLTIPRQNFEVVQGGNAPGADWSLVPAIGLGAEGFVSRNLALRLDATYSVPTGTNKMESWRVTAGVVWHFSTGGR